MRARSPQLGAIWAQSLDRVIGDGHGMPWYLPEDLKHFKETTLGHPVIMGRRTWESLPFRPLPSRPNHVVSSREPGAWSDGAYVSPDLPDIATDAWIMGGAQLYEATLDEVSVIELTLIDGYLASALGHRAVRAPRIEAADFELVSDSGWLTSERGHLILPAVESEQAPGDQAVSDPSAAPGLRYKFQRYARRPE
ncbi:dihydrofolate reductase [Corynebacterium aquatimens]|uniref:dihydrofolate reductase n=1 Tax=Corynebacterium aquatimens TaxID=1190508 RepID=A0A931DZJ3_9CORY|nr:dihydrofolate reductase [Corynebacterium aquatimens]MBG6121072.1 dihydrofolate reductase [Corynebacterium aquatimens]WJY66370.1 Dihydrofolate reductase [Corynebacterium aquatimens]